jgi:predicted transposase YbfD/YdcC
MDQRQYSRLAQALADVPDPRHARGKQFEWAFLLGIIASALVSQQRNGRAIAQWAQRHARPLIAAFHPAHQRVPSASTIRRTLHRIDVAALEQRLARLALPAPRRTRDTTAQTQPTALRGLAIDGKHVRGAGACGHPTHLVSLVVHTTGQVLAQTAVAHKRHESSAVPALLHARDLTGAIITMDAGLTQQALAAQVVRQGGHYLMVVKRNQHQVYEDLTWFFATPPLACDPPWRVVETVSKGHGRLETRRLTCTADTDAYLTWPGVQQILRRECERIIIKTGQVTRSVTYGLTSVEPSTASPGVLEAVWRGHWTIENQVHYVRDVTMGEDAQHLARGSAPQAAAALRNSLLNLLRAAGWTNIADALRYYNNSARDAIRFVTAPIARL